VTSYALQVAFGGNINFLQFTDNTCFIVDFLCISLSILNSQLSTVDKKRFVNPRITPFFAPSGQFAAKKSTFSRAKNDKMLLLTFCHIHQSNKDGLVILGTDYADCTDYTVKKTGFINALAITHVRYCVLLFFADFHQSFS
jgi:hypothetical protein